MENEIKPRFHQKTPIPKVPEGMKLVKFHGEPALIPARAETDQPYGRTRFTVRQATYLIELERERIKRAIDAQQL